MYVRDVPTRTTYKSNLDFLSSRIQYEYREHTLYVEDCMFGSHFVCSKCTVRKPVRKVCMLFTGVNLRRRKPAQTKHHLEPAGPLAATMAKEVIVVVEQHTQRARTLKLGRTERVGVIIGCCCCCNRKGCRSSIRTGTWGRGSGLANAAAAASKEDGGGGRCKRMLLQQP